MGEQNDGAISGRFMCAILDDMRDCAKTHNYSYLPGLIEEAQYRANRMEDRLDRVKDVARFESRRNELKDEIDELKKTKTDLGGKVGYLE
jgi:vacuolar-type H+-ATPase subunit I/STV1